MIISGENILLVSSLLLIVGVLIGRSSYRTGLPLLLVFLIVGMLFGTDGIGFHFDDMHTAQFGGMVALCIILFSGGLSTNVRAIRPVVAPGLVLSTVGVLLTALLTGAFIFWLSGMSWTNIHFAIIPSLLLAATMSSTDSASVFGILGSKNVRLKENLRPMLELESGSNDPMAYMLTIILIECATVGDGLSAASILLQLLLQFGVGGAMGFIIGYLGVKLAEAYRRIGESRSEDSGQSTAMISILMVGTVFLTFTLTSLLQGNGYLAVYVCGMVAGNFRLPWKRGVTRFMVGITWLAQIVVFMMLGLLVNPHEMLQVGAVSLLIGLFMIFVGRPLSVMLCLAPFRKISSRARMFVSWVGLRGAVPIIFATYPVVAHVEGASQIFNIVFFVTLLSLLLQGTTVLASARRLNLIDKSVEEPEEFGVELDEALPTELQTLVLQDADLRDGDTLADIQLPVGGLVMMIRREGRYMVPDGKRRLRPGDALLIISERPGIGNSDGNKV